VEVFCGHGLGRVFHDAPNILHYGRPDVKVLDDGWTAVTKDRSLSAQFEHSVGVTRDGVEIFTLSPQGLHKPPYN
ncbi:MAG TPA: type I methionyl aminopeptidase, partial [Sphingomonadales bacterium]